MELIFLGTGAGMPSKQRNVSSIALTLYQETNHIWLFDCGEATQHQILHTAIKPSKINKIFITHMHGDHIFGLPGVLSSRSFQGGRDGLTIYGPKGIEDFVHHALQLSETHLSYPLAFVEVHDGQLIDDDQFSVYCQQLEHGIPSYGYRIVEKDKPGQLLVDRLKEAGVSPGPIYKAIKDNEVVTTEDGRIIHRSDYIGPPKKGRTIAIIGDTRCSEAYQNLVKHVDVLVHEATFGQDKATLAHDYYHSTTAQAATLAKKQHVGRLVLTHISSRYQPSDTAELLAEARDIFKDTYLAQDFFNITI
ncbi:ribonuclease Z [Lentibacillus saliphilus]|uniref:ribonuclease Z n=1 Tax=Lentibacillus saliphilus TaxID=2737028 RepID=UPI001C30A991|nr:ribonuclease Z [Lentibacillus saliphilus]